MGFHFRKSIKLLSGLNLTLAKAGVSAWFNDNAATANSQREHHDDARMPRSGIRYSEELSRRAAIARIRAQVESVDNRARRLIGWIVVAILAVALTAGLLYACVTVLRSATARHGSVALKIQSPATSVDIKHEPQLLLPTLDEYTFLHRV